MSDAVKNDSHCAGNDPALPKPESSIGSYVVIALVALGVAALAAYQFFGCAGCYGGL
jgi:hypothetical protein